MRRRRTGIGDGGATHRSPACPDGKGLALYPSRHDKPCALRYRLVCGEESTRWFDLEVLSPAKVEKPLRVGAGWAELCPGVYLSCRKEEGGIAFALTPAGSRRMRPAMG